MKRFVLIFLLAIVSTQGFSKFLLDSLETRKKGQFYLLWGYNREIYTKSTIHFQNKTGDPTRTDEFGVYDFTLYNVTAHDRPGFDLIRDVINITIPQFNFRIGYYFNNKKDWGVELSYDHAKYIVTDYQTAHIKGTILGQYMDKDTLMDPHYIHFEHSDGANFWMFNAMKRWKILKSKNGKHNLGIVFKPGIGFVYPRTDVTIFGHRLNNNWKISGVIAGVEADVRAELWRGWVISFAGKAAYADYVNCLVQGKGNGKAQHTFGTLECVLTMGYQFNWGHMGKRCGFIWR